MNSTPAKMPQHVAIIMDGNRRWARQKGLPVVEGHRRVVDHLVEKLVDHAIELGIPYLTLWAFSTENWDRDKEELGAIMKLFRYGMKRKSEDLFKKGVRIHMLGELDRFPEDIAETAKGWIEKSKDNHKMTVTFALNYGGRDEITRAMNRWLQQNPGKTEISQEELAANLDTAGMPDPDLIIRPGGQLRLSGFMPWQAVYAELYFTDVLMPDFDIAEFDKAIEDYQNRQRRFGK